MSQTYLVIGEVRDGKLRQVTSELIQAARLARKDGDRIVAALLGYGIGPFAAELSRYEIDEVIAADRAELEHYNPDAYFPVLCAIIGQAGADAVFFGHTAIGRDLAPMAAARLGAGQSSDAVSVERSADDLLFTRPLYAGKAFEQKR
ncbi:electron transfer flavoprotein subunit alpha/FixB family protein, partial [Paenibacillus filicis]